MTFFSALFLEFRSALAAANDNSASSLRNAQLLFAVWAPVNMMGLALLKFLLLSQKKASDGCFKPHIFPVLFTAFGRLFGKHTIIYPEKE